MSQVTIVGSFNVDHVWRCDRLPAVGETLRGEYSTGPGGKGFNQAMASARCGVPSQFICALGVDSAAQWAQDLARDAQLELIAKRSDHPTGTAGIWVDGSGHNSIVIGAGANADLDPTFVLEHAAALQGARVVLAQLETPLPSILQAFRLAHGAGVMTVLNPAPAAHHLPTALLDSCDILTPNETELALLLGMDSADLDQPMGDGELHALCRELLPGGTVVVTLGSAGCFVSHADSAPRGDSSVFYRVPAQTANVVDTTGAGDAFNGALCASMASRPDAAFRTHVEWAGAFASASTEKQGAALSMPTADQVTQRFGMTLR